jgi:hypothetical protein
MATGWRSTTSGWRCRRGRSLGCWGRTGPARRPPWRSCRGCGGGTGGACGCSGWTRSGTGTGCGGGSGRSCSRRRCLTGCGSGRRCGCSPVGGTGRPRWSGWGGAGGWRGCGGGRSPSCQGVSSSGCSSRWPWSTGPRWCSSTSSPLGRTRRLGGPPGTWSAGSGTTAPRWCWSPTSWRRPRSSATGWRLSTGAGWWPPGRRRSWSGGPTPPSGSASPGRTRTPPGCSTSPGSRGSPAVATPSRSSATAPWPSGWPRGLASRGVAPDDFRTHHPDLEDVFLALTGRDLGA